jgi:DNA-binding MarR family transcriptional regulator
MSQSWVILHLIRENGLRQADIAARMDVATVTISKLIDRLVARGFVERRADLKDRRTNRIFVTEAAQDMLRTMRSAQGEVDAIANSGIDHDELDITLRVLGRMRHNLKSALHDAE